MKIAIVGYGKMGKEIEKLALERGHTITLVVDDNEQHKIESHEFSHADVAVEFSHPNAAVENYKKCFAKGIPVVSGTTGWLNDWDNVLAHCNKMKGTFFYASNFSLGVNILFYLNNQLARIMNKFTQYEVEIAETHHIQKLDAPSGTAISLAQDMMQHLDRKKEWKFNEKELENEIKITAHRLDKVPGEHTIKYESNEDTIELKHAAKSRRGFALGAVLAAEFVQNKTGVFSMHDLLKF